MKILNPLSRLWAACMLFITLLCSDGFPQMPDWIMIRDPDGNRYYSDPNGRIYTSGTPEFDFKPVSEEGIVYYYTQGLELIRRGHKVEGLVLLKSIMALPDRGRATEYRARASVEINRLIKKEGERYEMLNREASILLFKEKPGVILVNDLMRYRVELPEEPGILSRRMRGTHNYGYYGLLIGVRFDNTGTGPQSGAWDALVAIDAERFPSEVLGMKALKKNWAQNLGRDSFRRTPVRSNDREELSRFEDDGPYAGYEAFFLRGQYGYCVRIITAGPDRPGHWSEMETILNSFRFSFVEKHQITR